MNRDEIITDGGSFVQAILSNNLYLLLLKVPFSTCLLNFTISSFSGTKALWMQVL
jgi:hypothetical protein